MFAAIIGRFANDNPLDGHTAPFTTKFNVDVSTVVCKVAMNGL